MTRDFGFLSVPCADVFTIHETSGTTGVPKAFFLTWEDWTRYAEKYARSFASQGLGNGDRVVVCTSYGMNVGGNTMTVAAHRLKMTIIPTGKCTFPSRIITSYRPTAIVGSVFKLLHLAERLEIEGIDPRETSIRRLVVGGESFAEASRKYLSERWDCPVYNTYGSTEGTMCGECTAQDGLHVPEDMVHLDLYDPEKREFVPDGAEGRIVLSHLLPVGARSGMVLLNYDSEDITSIVSRETVRLRPDPPPHSSPPPGERPSRRSAWAGSTGPRSSGPSSTQTTWRISRGSTRPSSTAMATRARFSGSGSSAGILPCATGGQSRSGCSRPSPRTTRCSPHADWRRIPRALLVHGAGGLEPRRRSRGGRSGSSIVGNPELGTGPKPFPVGSAKRTRMRAHGGGGLSPRRMEYLKFLLERGGPVTNADLAARFGVDPSTSTKTVRPWSRPAWSSTRRIGGSPSPSGGGDAPSS